jgi:hypothetical protein
VNHSTDLTSLIGREFRSRGQLNGDAEESRAVSADCEDSCCERAGVHLDTAGCEMQVIDL